MSPDPVIRTERHHRAERDRTQWATSIALFLALFVGIYLAPGRPGGDNPVQREKAAITHVSADGAGRSLAGL